jgi:hypothetical protein
MIKKKRRKNQKGKSPAKTKSTADMTRGQLGFTLLSFLGGSLLGATVGKYSGVAGIAAAGLGVWKQNVYATAAGAGLILAPHRVPVEQGTSGVNGVDGFSVKEMTDNAKNYFQNIGSKFTLKPSSTSNVSGTNGLGNNNEEVTYFMNPYSKRQDSLDLSELDRVSEQVAQMASQSPGHSEVDPEDRNF